MKEREEILKAYSRRVSNILHSFVDEDIQKAKRAEIGEVREHGGVKYKKVAEGKWLPVTDGKRDPKQEDQPTDKTSKQDEGSKSSTASKEGDSTLSPEQQTQYDQAKDTVSKNIKFLNSEGPLSTIAKKIVNDGIRSMMTALGVSKETAKSTDYIETIPGLSSEAHYEGTLKQLVEGLGKQFQKKNDDAIKNVISPQPTEPRKDMSAIKSDLKGALQERFSDPESTEAHDKVNNLIAEAAASAGMDYDEAKSYPWTQDEVFGGGSNTNVGKAMAALDEYLQEIKDERAKQPGSKANPHKIWNGIAMESDGAGNLKAKFSDMGMSKETIKDGDYVTWTLRSRGFGGDEVVHSRVKINPDGTFSHEDRASISDMKKESKKLFAQIKEAKASGDTEKHAKLTEQRNNLRTDLKDRGHK